MVCVHRWQRFRSCDQTCNDVCLRQREASRAVIVLPHNGQYVCLQHRLCCAECFGERFQWWRLHIRWQNERRQRGNA